MNDEISDILDAKKDGDVYNVVFLVPQQRRVRAKSQAAAAARAIALAGTVRGTVLKSVIREDGVLPICPDCEAEAQELRARRKRTLVPFWAAKPEEPK